MQHIRNLIVIAAMGAALISTSVRADDDMVRNYVFHGDHQATKNSYGECWRTSYKDTTEKLEACGYEKPREVIMVTKEVVGAKTAVSVTATVDEFITMSAAILFGFDSDVLSNDGMAIIDERIGKYRGRVKRTLDVEVTGHTDSTGPEAYNQKLSERRAQSVANYIDKQSDVPHSEIKVTGKGESEPVASNDTREGRAVNRRVVIHVEGTIIK